MIWLSAADIMPEVGKSVLVRSAKDSLDGDPIHDYWYGTVKRDETAIYPIKVIDEYGWHWTLWDYMEWTEVSTR